MRVKTHFAYCIITPLVSMTAIKCYTAAMSIFITSAFSLPGPIATPPFPALPKIVDEYAKLREYELIQQTEIKAIQNEKRCLS